MKQRKLGKTGIKVSEIGFGAWAIGKYQWPGQEDEDSVRALNKALDLGCTFFDTAVAYGWGHSEKLIGEVLRDRGMLDEAVIATKVPPKNRLWSPPPSEPISEAFPVGWITECCNKSLESIGRNYLDLLQLHTWNAQWNKETLWRDELLGLKDEGKIRSFGISVRSADPNEANSLVKAKNVDSIQAVYNVLEQSPERELFPIAESTGTAIIARQPLAAGGLTGKFTPKTSFEEGDWRSRGGKEWVGRIVEQAGLVKEALPEESKLSETALKFCLSSEAVSSVIPGIRSEAQAEMNISVSGSLRAFELERLRELWSSGKIGGLRFA